MTARTFSGAELAARVWWNLSKNHRADRGIAGLRFKLITAAGVDENLTLQAIGELALEGYPAKSIQIATVRDRVSQIENAPKVRALIASLAGGLRMPR